MGDKSKVDLEARPANIVLSPAVMSIPLASSDGSLRLCLHLERLVADCRTARVSCDCGQEGRGGEKIAGLYK